VVGVHPAYQGRGLARPLTRLGTSHLARRGLATVELYVDGDNTAALATYRKEGFTSVAIDAMYAVPGTSR
jgi:mycothiol synthase